MLTITILKMECTTDMPKISYLTALDFYMITCYGFVLFSILEFAMVHQDKFNHDLFQMERLKQKVAKKNLQQKIQSVKRPRFKRLNILFDKKGQEKGLKPIISYIVDRKCLASLDENRHQSRLLQFSIRINKIDQIAKFLFPISFALFNLAYFLFLINKRRV